MSIRWVGAVVGFDAIIIGSGTIGVNVALELAKRRWRNVLVVDRMAGSIGRTTQRCGGGVRMLFESPVNTYLARRSKLIRDGRRRFCSSSALASVRTGYAFLATDESDQKVLQRSIAGQNRLGVDAQWLSRDDLKALLPHLGVGGQVLGGVWHKDGERLNSHAWAVFERRLAEEAGVKFVEGLEVAGVEVGNGRQRVATNRGTLDAGVVVNAAGPWGMDLANSLGWRPPVSCKVHQVCTTDVCVEAGQTVPTVLLSGGIGVRSLDGHIAIGCTDQNAARGWHRARASTILEKHMLRTVGTCLRNLSNIHVVGRFCCVYDITPDGVPLVGSTRPEFGLYCALGFNGHGFMQSPAVGELVADVIVGECVGRAVHSALRPLRFARGPRAVRSETPGDSGG